MDSEFLFYMEFYISSMVLKMMEFTSYYKKVIK